MKTEEDCDPFKPKGLFNKLKKPLDLIKSVN